MKARLAASVLALGTILAATALADETNTACEAGYQCLKPVIVYGRPPKPIVVVELVRPTAAHEAGAAHEEMKLEWLKKAEPKALRPSSQ